MFVGWYLMMPPDSAKVPHSVDSEAPLSHWITVATFDTADNCEKALADVQKKNQDPIALTKPENFSVFANMPTRWENRARLMPAASRVTISA